MEYLKRYINAYLNKPYSIYLNKNNCLPKRSVNLITNLLAANKTKSVLTA